MLTALIDNIKQKKAQLDRLRPMSAAALTQLQKHCDIRGKSLRDHLEAVDHYEALIWMSELAAHTTPIGESTVCGLHRRIVARSQPEIAGIYSQLRRRFAGSAVVFPNPVKIPQLMEEFDTWLKAAPSDPVSAFEAHFRLTAIHPFGDGNGRTARLLMNLLLIRGGYPLLAVRPEDRKTYLDSLEWASLTGDAATYQTLMHQRLDATLGAYLSALREALPRPDPTREPSPQEPTPRG